MAQGALPLGKRGSSRKQRAASNRASRWRRHGGATGWQSDASAAGKEVPRTGCCCSQKARCLIEALKEVRARSGARDVGPVVSQFTQFY